MAKRIIKDKKIKIYKLYQEVIYGYTVDTYKPIHEGKLWAYYRFNKGNEIFTQFYNYKADALFIINNRGGIDTTSIILYNHKVYKITAIDDYEGYKSDLKIFVSLDSQNCDPSDFSGVVDD